MTTGHEIVEVLRANYFDSDEFSVRTITAPSAFARLIVLVTRAGVRSRLFGLRLVDYPLSAPSLRFWHTSRWDDAEFDFDFTASGDAGSGTTESPAHIPTMCIPYHIDYYKEDWHRDKPWVVSEADTLMADLVGNILRRA